MGRIALIALSIMSLGGCGHIAATAVGEVESRYDASSSPRTAIISTAGRRAFGPMCVLVQDLNLYREVVVDAGAVMLQVECRRVAGVFGERSEPYGRAALALDVEAGQHYRIRFSEEFGFPHVAVTTAEDDSPVIQRSLLKPRVATRAQARNVTLVSRSGAGIIPCRFGRPWTDRKTSSVSQPAVSFVRVPYSHQIVAECSTFAYITGYVKERYEALVDFEPESGRLYTVHMDEKDPDFVFVTDVSSDVQTIAHVRAVRTH